MQLYVGVYSGYSQKVRIALAEKGLAETIPCIVVTREEKTSAAYMARNPLGLVPTLELDDGSHLTESTPIIEYLEARFPAPPLVPADPLLRARMHALDHYGDQALTPPMRRLWNALTRPGRGEDQGGAAGTAVREHIRGVFRYLATVLADGPYLVGEFSIADIAFMQRLQHLALLGEDLATDVSAVRAWADRLRRRPSWDATMYPPLPRSG